MLRLAAAAESGDAAPAPEQVAAYRYLKENEASVAASVVRAIFEQYPDIQASYGDDDEDEAGPRLPEVEQPDDLKPLIGLGTVHVLFVARDGVAYVGFELGCTWDDEHGAGVMTHKGRVVEVGGADTSFLEWIAEKDGGRMIGE